MLCLRRRAARVRDRRVETGFRTTSGLTPSGDIAVVSSIFCDVSKEFDVLAALLEIKLIALVFNQSYFISTYMHACYWC